MPVVGSNYVLPWIFGSNQAPTAAGQPAGPVNTSTFPLQLGDDLYDIAATFNNLVGVAYAGTITVSGGGLGDTVLTPLVTAKFNTLQLIFRNVLPSTAAVNLYLQVHSGGSFQNTSYLCSSYIFPNGGAAITSAGSGAGLIICGTDISNSGIGISASFLVSNLNGTTAPKMWTFDGSYQNTTPGATRGAGGGYWNNNAAVDGFQIVPTAGTITSGFIDIYGVH